MTLQPFLTKLNYRFGHKSRLFKIDEVFLYSLLAFIQAPGVPLFGIKKNQNTLSFKTRQRSGLLRDFGDYCNKDASFKKMKIIYFY